MMVVGRLQLVWMRALTVSALAILWGCNTLGSSFDPDGALTIAGEPSDQ